MRLGILSCVYGRPKLTEIFAKSLSRLKEQFEIVPLIVGSEGEKSVSYARKYGLIYLEWPNSPLGKKFNAGMRVFSNLKIDAVMVLGSDDFIQDKYIQLVKKYLSKGADLVGSTDCYFYSLDDQELGYWPGYAAPRVGETIGLGRVLSKKILIRCQWNPWIGKHDKGLDGLMMSRISRYRPVIRAVNLKREGILNVDVKGKSNITRYRCYSGKLDIVDKNNLLHLPEGQEILNL